MRKVSRNSREFTNWASYVHDEAVDEGRILMIGGPDDLDNFLIEQMRDINAQPIVFNNQLSGMKFEDDQYHTLFLIRFSS